MEKCGFYGLDVSLILRITIALNQFVLWVDIMSLGKNKITRSFYLSAALAVACLSSGQAFSNEPTQDMPEIDLADAKIWLEAFKLQAKDQGISTDTLNAAFEDWKPIDKVLFYDRRQPEFSRTFWGYMERAISEQRIRRGQELMVKHKDLLDKVYKKFGVQPRFLVAFWGLESNFGDYTGGFPVIDALATLAHDKRRREFFTKELVLALRILQDKHIPPQKMLGSWAGAMGQTQFMPSTFTGYAYDGDGDGRKDLWESLSDVMHSSSNYLSSIGWNKEETWGREVKLPDGFNFEIADLKVKKSLSEWQRLGVRKASGMDLPAVDIEGSIVLPAGHKGPAFMVYNNFRKIMVWNRSILYAIAVGHLSDRLVGKPGLIAKKPLNDKPLHRNDVIALQSALNSLGFNAGSPDGILGSNTRRALKEYQVINKLPADGYPEASLVAKIIELGSK